MRQPDPLRVSGAHSEVRWCRPRRGILIGPRAAIIEAEDVLHVNTDDMFQRDAQYPRSWTAPQRARQFLREVRYRQALAKVNVIQRDVATGDFASLLDAEVMS